MFERATRMLGEFTVLLIVTQLVYWLLYALSRISFSTRMVVVGLLFIVVSVSVITAKG